MLNLSTHSAEELYRHGLALLEKELPLKLRLMGLRFTSIYVPTNVRMTHLCPRGKVHGELDKVFPIFITLT